MNIRTLCAGLAAAAVLSGSVSVPIAAWAHSDLDYASHHRQKTKNQWRNIGIGSAAAGALGLLTHNSTLLVGGAAGALYSASRYEHDRRSQSRIDRERARVYGQRTYYEHGHRYVRHTVWHNGHKYYRFERA